MLFSVRSLLVVGLAVMVAGATTHAAPPPRDSARAHYEAGTKHYALSELEPALTEFKEAYRLKPDPVFLYNIAQCYRRLDDPQQAADFYRSYLREQPTSPKRADVERILAELDAQIAAKREEQRRADEEKARAAAAVVAPPPPTIDAAIVAPPPRHDRPLVKKPWFWVAVVGGAGVVATAVALGVVFGTSRDPHAQLGTLNFGGK